VVGPDSNDVGVYIPSLLGLDTEIIQGAAFVYGACKDANKKTYRKKAGYI